MNVLTREDLTILMEKQDDHCISIYLPTYRAGSETHQGRIRLKNLLQEAERRLIANGMRSPDAERYLKPIQKLGVDNSFWQHQRDGLAIFLASDALHYYSLPVNFKEFVHIGGRFHLKPLLPLLSADGQFYLLALSQNRVRALECTRTSVREIEGLDIPHDLAESMQFDDPERQLQYHTNTLEANDRGAAAIYHGHGVGIDDNKDNILRYFRLIDRGLHPLLRDKKVPLVLAGVEFLFPIYEEANTYAYLADEGIPGNPEELSAEDLQTLAWPLVEHYFHKAEQEALTYYGPLKGTGLTTQDIAEAAPAAYQGRVEVLFVADDSEKWGRYDPASNAVQLHQEPEIDDEDMLDFTALQTIKNGGTVYMLAGDQIPDGGTLAALFRY